MFKRVFSPKRPNSITKSVRMPEPMANVLQKLANDSGETLNSYIVLVLDEYLQGLLKAGKIKLPKEDKAS